MSKRILFGDKITMVVFNGGRLQLRHCTVDMREPGWISCTDWPALVDGVRVDDEGITWCREHIAKESDAGRALLVSAGLLELPEQVLRVPMIMRYMQG